ncbi:MAG: hypothetical protein AAF668_12290 [Pseudomonadota bacterium]
MRIVPQCIRLGVVWVIAFTQLLGSANAQQQSRLGHLSRDGKVIAGPHLPGDAYVALRSGVDSIGIEFDLTEQNTRSSVFVGSDFVIERNLDGYKVFDFRFRRILEVPLGAASFANRSLFGEFFLNFAFLRNNLGTYAILAKAEGKEAQLERFLVERHNGLAYPLEYAFESLKEPRISRKRRGEGSVEFFVDGSLVTVVDQGSMSFPTANHGASFSAWLVWTKRAHPRVAERIASSGKLPSSIVWPNAGDQSRPTYGLDEEKSIQLSNARQARRGFDFLKSLKSSPPSWQDALPIELTAVLFSAASGIANDGPRTDQEILSLFQQYLDEDSAFNAALLALSPETNCNSFVSKAEGGRRLCQLFQEYPELYDAPSFGRFGDALRLDGSGRHDEAAIIVNDLRERTSNYHVSLDIVYANMLVEAKSSGQIFSAGLSEEYKEIPELFLKAFKHDPYAVAWYKDYFNYLESYPETVDDQYIVQREAYVVLDLGRSLPERPIASILQTTSDSEAKIVSDFETNFPSFD